MNRIFLTFLFAIIGIQSYGQGLEGIVKDSSSNEGIPFVYLHLVDLDANIMADEHGHFRLPVSLHLPIKIACTAIGYENKIVVLAEADVKKEIVIYLNPAHFELEEVNITVTSGVQQRFTMSNVESKSVKELSAIVSPNLTEALTNLGSVYNNSTGNGIGKPVIRGLSGNRVLTTLNGLRIENQQWGADHGLGISELGIDRVDLIKGPASLVYGADALGGVIHLTDEKYTATGNVEARLSSQFESNSLTTKNKLGIKLARAQFRLNLYAYYLNSADYQLPTGQFAKNSRWQEGAFKVALGYNRKNWVMNARYNYNRSFIGLPGHTHDSIVNPAEFKVNRQDRHWILPVQQINSHYFLLENAFYFDRSDLKLNLGLTSNQLQEFEEKVSIPGISNLLNTYSYNLKYRYQVNKNQQLLGGFQGMVQQNMNLSEAEEELVPNANTFDNGAYLLWNYSKKSWESQIGGRYDYRLLQTNSQNFSFNAFNGSAGLVKKIQKITLRLNLSSGYRPPNLSELLADGVHHGNIRYELGSVNLQPEIARQLDFNFQWEGEHLKLVANPFYNHIDQYIYLAPVDSVINGYPVFAYAQSPQAVLTGGDLGFHYHPHFLHLLHLESTLSYLYTEDQSGKALPLIPQTRVNTIAKLLFKSKGFFQVQNINLQYLYFFAQNKTSAFETSSPAYQLVHLGTQLKLNFKQALILKLGVRNLLNENYIDHLSRLKNIGLEAPGRNFYVGLQWQINQFKNLHENEN